MAETIPDPASTAEEAMDASRAGRGAAPMPRATLPGTSRDLDLVYYHERSVDEVSTIIGVPAATVKTRMFHARKRLAELLRATGIETVRV